MPKLFIRQTEVLVAGIKFAEPNYTINFKTNFDYDEDPNEGEIEILNLTNDTISKIEKGQDIILNAGYKDDVGTIFAGAIEKAELKVNFPDRTLKISAYEASESYLNTNISKSYTAGTKASYIIKDLLGTVGLEIGYFQLSNDITYLSGKIVSGSLRNAIRDIVINDCSSKIYITNGAVIVRPDGTGNDIGFVLNSDTGLIESPSKIDKQSTDGVDTADYSVKCLLNHRVRTDSIFQIESRTANGLFRVNKGYHQKTDSDFITYTEVIAV